MSLSGPQKIIDLDILPEKDWNIEAEALHLYHDQLWKHEQVGCVLCVESERNDAHGQTLSLRGDPRQFLCLTHGPLEEVQYSITRTVVIKMDTLEREVSQAVHDAILIPKDISDEEREELLDRLISAAAETEADPDLSPAE